MHSCAWDQHAPGPLRQKTNAGAHSCPPGVPLKGKGRVVVVLLPYLLTGEFPERQHVGSGLLRMWRVGRKELTGHLSRDRSHVLNLLPK